MSRKNDLLVLSEQYAKVYEGMKVVEAPASEGDASAVNMGPGGVLEVQPDGQYPEPPAKDENAENAFSYNPMDELSPIAKQIRELLRSAADDELRPEHFQEAAKIIAGEPTEWAPGEYEELVDKLAFVIDRFASTKMNPGL